jgi:hypothetical protein
MEKLATLLIRLIAPLGLGHSGESAPKDAVVARKPVLVECHLLIIIEVLAETSRRRSVKTATPKGAQSIAELAVGLVGDSATKNVVVVFKPDLDESALNQ